MEKQFKIGDIVNHQLSQNRMFVLATSSDGMVSCRYFDNNGLVQSQWCYPEELKEFTPTESQSGFKQ